MKTGNTKPAMSANDQTTDEENQTECNGKRKTIGTVESAAWFSNLWSVCVHSRKPPFVASKFREDMGSIEVTFTPAVWVLSTYPANEWCPNL